MNEAGSIRYGLELTGQSQFNADLNKAGKSFDELGKAAENSGAGISNIVKGSAIGTAAVAGVGVAVGATVNFLKGSVSEFLASEESLSNLTASVEATNKAFGRGLDVSALSDFATEVQNKTGFADDAIIQSQAVLATFGNVAKENFNRATETATNLSRTFGQDLQSSATQLGKALENPIEGISALSRVGVSFSEEQKKVIEGLVETGNVAAAQGAILDAVYANTGDSAAKFGETTAGQLAILQEKFNGFKENVGSGLISLGTVAFEKFGTVWAEAVQVFNQVFTFLKPSIDELWATIQTNLVPALENFWHNIIEPLIPVLQGALKFAFEVVVLAIKGLIEYINIAVQVWSFAINTIVAVVNFFVDTAVSGFNSVVGAINTLIGWITSIKDTVIGALSGASSWLYGIGQNIIDGLINGVRSVAGKITDAVDSVVGAIPDTIKNLLGINSPSKVTTRLGEFIGQGLAKGLNSTQGLVNDAMTALTPNISPAVSFVGSAAAPNIVYRNYNVSTLFNSEREAQSLMKQLRDIEDRDISRSAF